MSTTYGTKYATAAAAAAYDEVICQHEEDPVWAAEQGLLTMLIRRHLPHPQSARTIDFACGSGRILKVLQPIVGDLTGVDISAAMLERAAARMPGVKLVQADILCTPESLPSDVDLVTAFRFLLLAEPPLRENCLRVLANRLRAERGIIVVNSHGNPWSFRLGARVRDAILARNTSLPHFSMRDMKLLAAKCGLRLVEATGCGFIPRSVQRRLPATWCARLERAMSGMPLLWRFGTNLMFVLRPL
jgi:SAM-dependent methyltransferase